jgi:acyl carrier protein
MSHVPADLRARIAAILVERLFLSLDPGSIGPEESLTLKYGVDSVRLFDTVVSLEDDFDISFEDEELVLEHFDSLDRMAGKVREKLEAST